MHITSKGSLRLEGDLDIEALQATLDTIVARHEVLRTVFVRADDGAEPQQVVMPAAAFELKQVDLSGQGGTVRRSPVGASRRRPTKSPAGSSGSGESGPVRSGTRSADPGRADPA